MILTLVRRLEGAPPALQGEQEVWRVRVGGVQDEGEEQDLVPASLLTPEVEVARAYEFEEFRLRMQRLAEALSKPDAQAEWTALPLQVRHARGALEEPVAIRARQAAAMAVRECISFARDAFADASGLWVRLE